MKKIESLKSEKFKGNILTTSKEVNGGAILPKIGSDCSDTWNDPLGGSFYSCIDWETGWFSSKKTYGAAYQRND